MGMMEYGGGGVARLRDRVPGTRQEIGERCREEVLSIVRRRGVPPQDEEDVCQDVLLALFQNLARDQYRGEASLETYVRRIAENKCADYFREKARREKWEAAPEAATSETLNDPPLEAIPDPHPSPEAAYVQQELYAALERAIERLTPRQRDIVIMHHRHDLTYAQIAEVLNLSEGVVVSQYRAAMRRLRKDKDVGEFL